MHQHSYSSGGDYMETKAWDKAFLINFHCLVAETHSNLASCMACITEIAHTMSDRDYTFSNTQNVNTIKRHSSASDSTNQPTNQPVSRPHSFLTQMSSLLMTFPGEMPRQGTVLLRPEV